ncbi:MAG: hypothetical protein GY835_05055, partial [bacterium]|nr:hypothetical protein [bacterium]
MRRRRTDSDPVKAQAELEKAARATFDRLEKDRANASVQTRNLLAHIREKLFEPNQNADELMKTCGHQGSASMALFHAETGSGIWEYVCGCRLETAVQLVRGSNLQFGDIAFQ